MYSDRRNRQKPPLPVKRPSDETPGQKPPRTIEREFVQGAFVRLFCTRPIKNRGVSRCVTYFVGIPGCVTNCDREEESKLAKNSVTYFMDGPLRAMFPNFPLIFSRFCAHKFSFVQHFPTVNLFVG